MQLIIDTDPGIDDAVALALALRSPEIKLLAVTTTYGNTTVQRATRNARAVLDMYGGETVPVYQGAARPLLRPLVTAAETHGSEGLGSAPVPSLDSSWPENGHVRAPLALLELLSAAAEPVTLVALGPLTNLALACALAPGVVRDNVHQVVVMGGSAWAPGNTTPVSEFNFWCDPESAQIVLQSGLPVRLVGLDVTRRCVLAGTAVEKLARSEDARHRWWAAALEFYCGFHREAERLDGCVLNDPLAVALTLNPAWGCSRAMAVEVALGHDQTRGQTICDQFGHSGRPANAQVYLQADPLPVLSLTNQLIWDELLSGAELAYGIAMGEAQWGGSKA